MKTRTGIVINLDYEHTPFALCEELWDKICNALQSNGFVLSGRLFLHDLPPERALPLARALVESLEQQVDFHERQFHRYIKEFYGFGYHNITNLMTPCPRDIEVRYSA